MSLYDKASLVFSGKAAAGKDGKAYNIKPVEKLKVDELITNNKLLTSDGWAFSDSNITVANGKIVFNEAAQYATARWDTDVFEEGKTYKISFKVEDFGGDASNSKLLAQQANNTQIDTNINRDGKYSFYYTPGAPDGTSNQNKFQLKTVTDSVKAKVSDFSIKEVEQKANDFTFTRGSNLTATLEGADGLIKKGRENQLLYSNQFDTTWTAVSASITGGQQGYDGSTNAWELKAIGNGSSHLARLNQVSLDVSGVSTFSVYAKAGNVNWIRLNGLKTGTNINNYFDLSGNGAVGASPSNTVVESKIESIGSGWFRISLTSKGDYPITEVRIQVAEADGDEIPATNSYVFIQNSQLEQGLAATPYIDRTGAAYSTAGVLENEPRYDYSGGDATLLLEPLRRNLVKHSEYLGDYNTSNATKTINALTSPEGFNNAATINVTSNSGSVYAQSGSVVESVEAETKYTFSFYVKRGTNTENYLAVRDQSAEVFISEDVAYTASTTEWKRISHTFTTPAGCTSIRLYPQRYSSGGQGTTHLFGIQLEKGSCVTSYIPTYGSAGTREADVIPQYTPSKTNLDKYTFFAHSHSDRVASDNRAPRLKGDGNSSLMGHFVNPDGKKQFFFDDNESNRPLSKATFGSFEAGDDTKYAFVVDNIALEAKLFIDGALRETMSLTKRADAKILSVGTSNGNPDRIKSIMYFPEALEDADVVSLTT